MKVKAKQAMWEDLSESYGLKYLQAYSPATYRNNSEIQSCLLEPRLSSALLAPIPNKESGVGGENKFQTSPNPSLYKDDKIDGKVNRLGVIKILSFIMIGH